jgi:hypothetical protein
VPKHRNLNIYVCRIKHGRQKNVGPSVPNLYAKLNLKTVDPVRVFIGAKKLQKFIF